jgi:peptidoglycan/xylan/chitin deacetylase (PgdA/CDA1 family)
VNARWMFNFLSPAGPKARLSVLIFHRVLSATDPLLPAEPDAVRFELQMRWLKVWFNVLPLSEAIERLGRGTLPARAAAITFDDGYADNYTNALPILRRLGLPATFFVATGYLNGGRMWNDTVIESLRCAATPELDLQRMKLGRYSLTTVEDRRRSINELLSRLKYLDGPTRQSCVGEVAAECGLQTARNLMMTSEQVRLLAAAGMTVGAHTVTHPILSRISDSEARAEIAESKIQLESITGVKVTLFAYPNGKPGTDYTKQHVRFVHGAGFEAACSTGWGAASQGCDIFQIPRFTPWDRSAWRYAVRLASNLRQDEVLVH